MKSLKTILFRFFVLFWFSLPSCVYGQFSTDAAFATSSVDGDGHATIKVRSDGYENDSTQIKLANVNNFGEGTEFVIQSTNEDGMSISSNSDLTMNTTEDILVLKPNGEVLINDLAGSGSGPVMATSDGLLSRSVSFDAFHKRENLCSGSIAISVIDTWFPLGPTISFIKEHSFTKINAQLLSHARYTGGSTTGVFFVVRIIGQNADMETYAAVIGVNNIDFIVAKSSFIGLPAATYTAQVYALIKNGTATGVLLDPGCFDGTILIEEGL